MASVPLSSFSGSWTTHENAPQTNCYVAATGQDSNAGCSLFGPKNSVGSDFNEETFSPGHVIVDSSKKSSKGGLYAYLWDKNKEIRTYFFPRNKIPIDLVEKQPKPESWGLPYGRFLINTTDCSSSHFKDHNIIINTALCGEWAGMYVQTVKIIPTSVCNTFESIFFLFYITYDRKILRN